MKTLSELPVDLLFIIAQSLDSASIARLSATCRRWKSILNSFSNLIYKRVAARDFGLLTLPNNFRSYHQIVLVNDAIKRGKCFPTDTGPDQQLPNPKYYLMAWPESESNSYLVALSGDLLIWVDKNDMINLIVKDLRLQDWSLDIIGYDYTLSGHTDRIGLILANQKGLLVSFDISCDIYVWNLMTREMTRKINTRGELGMIMSMNFHDTSVVCAGINGKIAVWNAVNGELIHSFSIPSIYLDILDEHQLNVSIYDKIVAFGLSDGKFYIYSLIEKKVIMQLDVKKPRFSRQNACSTNLVCFLI